jgi:uncharacterized membrane protein
MTSPPSSIQPEPEHPYADTPLDTVRSSTLGFVAGLRSMMPLALLSVHLEHEGPDIADGGWALDVLTSPWVAFALGVAALGELAADKLPIVPDRLMPVSLAGRVLLGGTASGLASLAAGRTSDRGALLGSLGAIVGSVAGYALRTTARRVWPGAVQSVLVAVSEDALAFALGRWAVRT